MSSKKTTPKKTGTSEANIKRESTKEAEALSDEQLDDVDGGIFSLPAIQKVR